jgi:hypothetical protein
MGRDEGKAKGLGWDLARECDNSSFNVSLSVSDICEALASVLVRPCPVALK